MEIQQQETGEAGAFFIKEAEQLLAEMTYTLKGPGIMRIDHTEVDDQLKGQKIGYQLLDHAVDYARKNNLKINPVCPFAHAVFEKRKEMYADVLQS